MNLRNNLLYRLAKKAYSFFIHSVCDAKRKPLLVPLRETLDYIYSNSAHNSADHIEVPILPPIMGGGGNKQNNSDLTIVSSNCFAGRVMQDIGMEYNSPTLGLYFMYPDYIDFLRHLHHYLTDAKIEFVEHSKYTLGDERRAAWSHWYPIGLLDGKVEIHFLHYHTEEEAAEKWYRRASRVNFDNLLIVGMQQNLCTELDIIEFDSLPFENKIMFSTLPLPLKSNEYMPEFKNSDSVGDPYRKADLFYKHLIKHFSEKSNHKI